MSRVFKVNAANNLFIVAEPVNGSVISLALIDWNDPKELIFTPDEYGNATRGSSPSCLWHGEIKWDGCYWPPTRAATSTTISGPPTGKSPRSTCPRKPGTPSSMPS